MRLILVFVFLFSVGAAGWARAESVSSTFAVFSEVCLENALDLDTAHSIASRRAASSDGTGEGIKVYHVPFARGAQFKVGLFEEQDVSIAFCAFQAFFDAPLAPIQQAELRALVSGGLAERYGDVRAHLNDPPSETFHGWNSWSGETCVAITLDALPKGNDLSVAIILTAGSKLPADMMICQRDR